MVLTGLIFNSSSPFTHHLGSFPSAPVTIGITVTLMFHYIFGSLSRSRYLSLYSLSFNFTLWSAETVKFTIRPVLVFCWPPPPTRSGRLAKNRWSVCIPTSQRTLCVSFSKTDSLLCIYRLFVRSIIIIIIIIALEEISDYISLFSPHSLVIWTTCSVSCNALVSVGISKISLFKLWRQWRWTIT